MAYTVEEIRELVMLAVDAGAAEFSCPDFTIKFPAPSPVVSPTPVLVSTPVPSSEAKAEAPKDPYDLLFKGNKPTLRKEPA